MTSRRGWQMRISPAAVVALAAWAAAVILCSIGTAASAPLPAPLVIPQPIPPITTGPVTEGPPTSAPAVVTIETSPTAPLAIEGGLLPIDTGVTPIHEVDEAVALNIFADPAVAQKLLFGRKPFVYDAKGRPDPMIVPWIRAEIIGTEHLNQALVYVREAEASTDVETKRSKYIQALEELDQVVKADPTAVLGKNAQTQIDKIRVAMEKIPPAGVVVTPTPTKPPELPAWIVANTRGIVFDQSPKQDHRVLVGDDLLRAGGTVPKFPNVKVVEIKREQVVYEFQNTRIPVKVEIELSRE